MQNALSEDSVQAHLNLCWVHMSEGTFPDNKVFYEKVCLSHMTISSVFILVGNPYVQKNNNQKLMNKNALSQ